MSSGSTVTKLGSAEKRFSLISLFSGAMGLDLGLEQAGFATRVCVEYERDSCETIRQNRPGLPVIEQDIRKVTTDEILDAAQIEKGGQFCIAGGPPCQSFSSGGKRSSILDPRGSLFMEFVRVIREAAPEYFIFENVAHIVTAAVRHRPIDTRPGKSWNLSIYSGNGTGNHTRAETDTAAPLEPDEMSGTAIAAILEEFETLGYHLTYGVLNAADYGVPQRRLRFIMIGSRKSVDLQLPPPTHGRQPDGQVKPWRTLKDALHGLIETAPLHSSYSEEVRGFFDRVPPGGNWRSLPRDLQPAALKGGYESGGGKTGFFRRLSWEEPAPTIIGKPNRKSSAICHPDHSRPLTVRECARVQGFPDSWQFAGAMHSRYLQIGNAVPPGLGRAVGATIIAAKTAASKSHLAVTQLSSADDYHRTQLERATQVLRSHARNKRMKAVAQLDLPNQ